MKMELSLHKEDGSPLARPAPAIFCWNLFDRSTPEVPKVQENLKMQPRSLIDHANFVLVV
jgi:hypothetical protein